MPLRHKDTKFHKIINTSQIPLVGFSELVFLWRKSDFSECTQTWNLKLAPIPINIGIRGET